MTRQTNLNGLSLHSWLHIYDSMVQNGPQNLLTIGFVRSTTNISCWRQIWQVHGVLKPKRSLSTEVSLFAASRTLGYGWRPMWWIATVMLHKDNDTSSNTSSIVMFCHLFIYRVFLSVLGVLAALIDRTEIAGWGCYSRGKSMLHAMESL